MPQQLIQSLIKFIIFQPYFPFWWIFALHSQMECFLIYAKDSWEHMPKSPKDNCPWPKDNILMWTDDTFVHAQTIYMEPSSSSQNQPHFLSWNDSVGQSFAIPFHGSNQTPAHSFPSPTAPPAGKDEQKCQSLQKLHSCLCAAAPPYSARESSSICGLTCKSGDTDNLLSYSVSSNIRDK